MKLHLKALSLGLLVLAPVTSMAASPIGNHLDAYYISSGLEVSVFGGSGDDDGDGFGAKGNFAFADNLFFSGEYQSSNYDDSDIDIDQLRAGVGINSAPGQVVFYGLAEFVRVELDSESENGFGLHGGLRYNVTDAFALDARLGYIDLDEGDGMEYLVGASFKFTDNFGAFADYRVTNQEGDGVEIDIDDLRVGARFTF